MRPGRGVVRKGCSVASTGAEAVVPEAHRSGRRRRAGLVALLVAAACTVVSVAEGGPGPGAAKSTLLAASTSGPVVDAPAFHGHGDLAFVSLGGLYVLDGSDDKLVQLAPLAGGATDPQFSPGQESCLVPEPDLVQPRVWPRLPG